MWKVENRESLWRVVDGSRVWGANRDCTQQEADAICVALNTILGVAPRIHDIIIGLLYPGGDSFRARVYKVIKLTHQTNWEILATYDHDIKLSGAVVTSMIICPVKECPGFWQPVTET